MFLQGDALTTLKDINNETVDCIITSPPYWALRDYKVEGQIWDNSNCEHEYGDKILPSMAKSGKHGPNSTIGAKFAQHDARQYEGSQFCSKCKAWKGQLGQEPTIELYVNHLIQIFNECKRVLKKEGTCWIVLGDTYGRNVGSQVKNSGWSDGGDTQYKQQKIKESGLPEKSLCMIPERFAIKMIDNGWILRNKIIWYKPNCMPSSATDRFTVDYEYIYFFVKSKKYYFKTQYEPMSTIENAPKNLFLYTMVPPKSKPSPVPTGVNLPFNSNSGSVKFA